MRKWVGAVLVVAIAGCGSSSLTAQDKKDIKQIEPIVFSCVSKGNLATSAGRKLIAGCIAPSGHKASFEKCANPYLTPTAFIGRSHRDKNLQALFVCWEHNR